MCVCVCVCVTDSVSFLQGQGTKAHTAPQISVPLLPCALLALQSGQCTAGRCAWMATYSATRVRCALFSCAPQELRFQFVPGLNDAHLTTLAATCTALTTLAMPWHPQVGCGHRHTHTHTHTIHASHCICGRGGIHASGVCVIAVCVCVCV